MRFLLNFRIIKYLFFLLLFSLILGGGLWFFIPSTFEKKIKKSDNLFILLEASRKLQKIWLEAEGYELLKSGELTCPNELGNVKFTTDHFLRCNPSFLQCLFSSKPKIKVVLQGKDYWVRVRQNFPALSFLSNEKRFYQLIDHSKYSSTGGSTRGFLVELVVEGEPDSFIQIVLEDSCNEVYLPPRV